MTTDSEGGFRDWDSSTFYQFRRGPSVVLRINPFLNTKRQGLFYKNQFFFFELFDVVPTFYYETLVPNPSLEFLFRFVETYLLLILKPSLFVFSPLRFFPYFLRTSTHRNLLRLHISLFVGYSLITPTPLTRPHQELLSL